MTEDQISALTLPMLLIYGESSIFFEPYIAARFAELRPDITQIVIDGAGHNSQAERPEIVGPEVVAFLAGGGT